MRILGIDPGLQRTGFGVVEVEGSKLHYVASGTISTLEVDRGNLPARLKVIFGGVAEVMARYQPQAASVEIPEAFWSDLAPLVRHWEAGVDR